MNSAEYRRISEKYINTVYKAALSCCKNKADAEDAVQNAFIKLLKTDTEFTDDEHIKKWLIRVAVNECKNVWKSFWHRNIVSFDELDKEPEYVENGQGELFSEIMKLPKKYSTVIHLYYYEGYSVKEISEILNISQSNVQIRLMRARNKLKEMLKEEAWL